MAKEVSLKGGRDVEALDYGLSLRGKGYGEEVEILADIIEYGEANPDSEVNTLLSEFAEETAVISGHTGEAIPEEYADILKKYGFRFDEKRNEWIHKDSGMTLMEYTG